MSFHGIRAGVIGIGFIGSAHIEALQRLGIEVAAVATSDPARARARAAALNLPPVAESVEALVNDDSIDVIHVASPNAVHAAQVRMALDAGKHVICEKPLGINAAQTADLVAQAAAHDLVTAVCFNLRFYPLNHQMASMVQSGEIGAPQLITGSFLQDWLLYDTDWNWRIDANAGGELQALGDIGSHWLDLARFVTGQDVVEVLAEMHNFVPVRQRTTESGDAPVAVETNSDDAATVLLRFSGGAKGAMIVSQVAAGRKNSLSLEIHGSTDSLSWTSSEPDDLWFGHRDRPSENLQRNPDTMSSGATAISTYPVGHVEGFGDTIRGLFSRVYADIAKGAPSTNPDYPTFADGHDALLVTEAIARSSQTQQWVTIERNSPA